MRFRLLSAHNFLQLYHTRATPKIKSRNAESDFLPHNLSDILALLPSLSFLFSPYLDVRKGRQRP